jgi:hypothetical protein
MVVGQNFEALEIFHKSRIDQQAVEALGFRALLAGVEQTLATEHDLFLFRECRVQRNARRFLDRQRR